MIGDLSSYESLAELIWFGGIILFSLIIFLGKSGRRGPLLNIGAVILILAYSGMLVEPLLSYAEYATLQWGVRLGITLILFDLVMRTAIPTPQEIRQGFYKLIHRGKK